MSNKRVVKNSSMHYNPAVKELTMRLWLEGKDRVGDRESD